MINSRPDAFTSKVTLDRALSKLGYRSRTQSLRLIQSDRVSVNGQIERNPGKWIDLDRDRIAVDGKTVIKCRPVYVMLNKPRGLVTTLADEKGRATVYRCFKKSKIPAVAPVGRLDKASEGLLLFTNDTAWANRLTDPDFHVEKIYHVQIDHQPDSKIIENMTRGVKVQPAGALKVKQARFIRSGKTTSWLEIVLTEGKNRHIRRMLDSMNISVLRLIRIAIGPLQLGNLAKGQYRPLTSEELMAINDVLN